MIDEHDLRALLAEAADAAPPPGRAPEELLAEVRAEVPAVTRPRFGGNPRVLALAAALVIAVLGIAKAVPGDNLPGPSLRSGDSSDVDVASEGLDDDLVLGPNESGTTGGEETRDSGGGGSVATTVPASGALPLSPVPPDLGAAAGTVDSGGITELEGGGGGAAPPAPVQATDSAKVVKTGSLVLEVDEGAFAGTVDRITSTATGIGGYVSESTTSRSGDAPSGTITVRVPADQFDRYLADVRKLGEVESEGVRGVEVSAQYTDLQARLASVTATRERLLTVLSEARNIGDIIAVQDRITGVQTEIEQLQGQLRLLDDQVAMGTLSVSLAEPGADQVALTTTEDDGGLGGAWDDARRHFGNGVEDVVAWSGTGAVLLLVVGAVALAVRFGWRRVRRQLL